MHATAKAAVILPLALSLCGASLGQQSSSAPAKKTTTTTKSSAAKTSTAAKKPTTPLQLKTEKDKASYAIGMSVGKKLHDDQADIDTAILLRGLKDAMAGSKTLLTDEDARAALIAMQQHMQEAMLTKNKKAGDEYRALNKAKEGVITLPSGLQYKVLQQGNGPKPTAQDSVVCNYKGTFIDGKQFDSSYDRGEPATFPVTGVIKGWTEALQLMPVGSKWQLVIPPDLAYGENGRPSIPPNSTLVFEVELVKIAEKAKETQPPATQPETEEHEKQPQQTPPPQDQPK